MLNYNIFDILIGFFFFISYCILFFFFEEIKIRRKKRKFRLRRYSTSYLKAWIINAYKLGQSQRFIIFCFQKIRKNLLGVQLHFRGSQIRAETF